MSLKGTVKIERYSAEIIDGEWVPLELLETIEQPNRITPSMMDNMRIGVATGRNDMVTQVSEAMYPGAMCLATDVAAQAWTKGTQAIAAVYNAGVEGGADSYWEIKSQVNGKGAGNGIRYIRTIVLTAGNTSYDDHPWTIVNLPTPCEQGEIEILQITYRIINDQTAISALNSVNYEISERIFRYNTYGGNDAFYPSTPYLLPYDETAWGKGIPWYSHNRILPGTNTTTDIYYTNIEKTYASVHVPEGLHRAKTNLILGASNDAAVPTLYTGLPFKGIAQGAQDLWTGMTNVTSNTGSRVQNVFGRDIDTGLNDRKPFFDSNHIATSAATVNLIDQGDWVEHRSDSYLIPYHYRITVETGGLTGVATYKLERRRWTHWQRNSVNWISYGLPIIQCGLYGGAVDESYLDITTADTRKHGQTLWHTRSYTDTSNAPNHNSTADGDAGTVFLRYVYPEAITFDYDGLTVFSLNEHNWTNLDTNSAQAQAFTEILQVSTDGTDIYIADAGQGLYQVLRDHDDFDTTNWTINKIGPPGITDDTSCRGVFHKGGTYWGGPGKIVDINIVRAGSNYAVGNTISVSGVNGTSFAANVARVDADGGITAISITNRGSGYIEDHCQLYVSTAGGVGAALDPIIGAGGEMWAIFNDTTDSVCYLAKMTHILSTGTSYDFDNSNPYVITRSAGNFFTDGFAAGQIIHVKSAEDAANDGRYTIASLTATALTVTEAITTNNVADTQAQIYAENWEVMRETITTTETLTYVANGTGVGDTITGSGTSFITQGFREGMKIVISSSTSNDGIYTIADVTATVITLVTEDVLVAEGPLSDTMAALTDFTLTSYTSGSPGPVNIIGLVMDQEHADDRFAILAPSTKYANSGVSEQANGSWSWWDYAGSTGTTVAGSTTEVRVTGNSNSYAIAGEQIGTLNIGPTSDGDSWQVHGVSYDLGGRVDFGLTTITGVADDNIGRYLSHRCKTNFDIGVYGEGTDGAQFLKSNRVAADFTTSTFDSIVAKYLDDPAFDNTTRMRPGSWSDPAVCMYGQFGHGLLFGRMANSASNFTSGGYVYSPNGSGIKSSEAALPYGYWETFGWDGTRWVLDNASAKTAHAQVSFSGTGITITAATGTIVGAGFTDWATDGFEVGDIITITTSEDPTNDGSYVIESLSGTTLTVTPNKLPAVNTTAAPDTTAVVVGDHALIDGLAISFDTSGAAPLVVDEYYECYVYDGIVNDNATSGSIDTYSPYMATAEGTDFESSTIPVADVGTVVSEPITIAQKSASGGGFTETGAYFYSPKPGIVGSSVTFNNVSNLGITEQQIPANTDFTFRYKDGSSSANPRIDVGIMPYADAADGNQQANTVMDYNLRVIHDFVNNPTRDLYTAEVRNVGNSTLIYTLNADRVVLTEDHTHVDYDGVTGTYGDFIGGYESATDLHAALDVLTMDDGSLITVDAVDANGTVTQFTVTTNSTKSSGNGQIDAVASSATLIDFNTTGNVITRTAGGTDFVTDGFRIGMKIQVDGATTELNDGAYTIQSVTTTTIVTEENLNTTETGTSATIDHAIVQVSSDGSGVNFALIPGTHNIEAADVANDEYALNRRGTTGNNLYWTLNGVEFYTHTSGPFNAQYSPCWSMQTHEFGNIYDATLDYTIDRRYLKVGNGTTTGADSINFRCLPTTYAGSNQLQLYYDSGAGPVEFTYVTDGRTAPSSGEVTILPFSGRLWFNTAQGGDTLTGNWTTTLTINIE